MGKIYIIILHFACLKHENANVFHFHCTEGDRRLLFAVLAAMSFVENVRKREMSGWFFFIIFI